MKCIVPFIFCLVFVTGCDNGHNSPQSSQYWQKVSDYHIDGSGNFIEVPFDGYKGITLNNDSTFTVRGGDICSGTDSGTSKGRFDERRFYIEDCDFNRSYRIDGGSLLLSLQGSETHGEKFHIILPD